MSTGGFGKCSFLHCRQQDVPSKIHFPFGAYTFCRKSNNSILFRHDNAVLTKVALRTISTLCYRPTQPEMIPITLLDIIFFLFGWCCGVIVTDFESRGFVYPRF